VNQDNKLKKKVLVVDDDLPLLTALSEKFKIEGFEVITSQNGKEGLDAALFNQPDMILLDLLMPEKNGLEMLRELRENEWGKSAAVIILTNSTDPSHMRQAIEGAAERFLIKSDWKLSDIVAKVKEALKM
jgi:two-component system alkaline phosphatase synthesis response regulator PhoP